MGRIPRRRQSHERYTTRASGKCSRMLYIGSIWERHKIQDCNFGKLDPMPLSFTTMCQPTVLKEASLSPRPPSKTVRKEAWQVQRDDSHQRGTGMVKPVADEEKQELKIDWYSTNSSRSRCRAHETNPKICRKLTRTTHSVKSRRKSFTTWATWSTSNCAKHLR